MTVRDAEEDAVYPARLLAIGLPLTIALGAVAAILLFPDLGLPVAAVVATILAPTDAALGLPLVTNPIIPARVRRVLNVESGLNDGIATPFLTFFLAVAVSAEGVGESHWWFGAAVGIGLAILVAVLVGGVGGWLLARARAIGFASELSSELAIVALPVLAYGASVVIGGNGFVAAFGAGLAFRATSGGRFTEETEFGEALGTFGSFLVWVIFGAVLAGPVFAHGVHPQTIVYAVLSLTVVRDAAGRDLPPAVGLPTGHDRTHRLVRTPRPRVGRLHAPRVLDARAGGAAGRRDRRDHHRHRAPVGHRARPDGGAARTHLRSTDPRRPGDRTGARGGERPATPASAAKATAGKTRPSRCGRGRGAWAGRPGVRAARPMRP